MKKMTLLFLVAMTWASALVAESKVEAQVQQIDTQIRVVKRRAQELESLLASLTENQSNFAGYGIPRTQDDTARVRQELYRARAEVGELAARRLYLTHSMKTQKTAPNKNQGAVEAVDPTPTVNPQDCSHGVVKVGDKWHCVLKQSANELSPAELNPEPKPELASGCDLGSFEIDGETHCIGSEPGGPLRAKMSLDFLGALMTDDPDHQSEEVPMSDDVYKQLRFE